MLQYVVIHRTDVQPQDVYCHERDPWRILSPTPSLVHHNNSLGHLPLATHPTLTHPPSTFIIRPPACSSAHHPDYPPTCHATCPPQPTHPSHLLQRQTTHLPTSTHAPSHPQPTLITTHLSTSTHLPIPAHLDYHPPAHLNPPTHPTCCSHLSSYPPTSLLAYATVQGHSQDVYCMPQGDT